MTRGYKAFVEMDADFSHNPEVIPTMIELLSTHSAVVGSRYVAGGGTENWHPVRKLISQFGSFYARNILGMKVRDLTGGFNAWTLEALRAINIDTLTSDGYSFQIELKYRCHRSGLAITETPITFSERREGQSKMSVGIVLEAFYKVWTFRFQAKSGIKALTDGKTTTS
jgi:dolichol-phosphate mannosyltransferase